MKNLKCIKCEKEKPVTEYYKHSQMTSGYLGKCKKCHKFDMIENRAKRPEYYREYDRQRTDNPKRVKARKDYAERMRNDPSAKDKKRIYTKRYYKKHAVKRAAHVIWGNYIRYNMGLIPKVCTKCNNSDNLSAHHEDYTKPLEIIWLCKPCHGLRHREINEEIRNGIDYSMRGF